MPTSTWEHLAPAKRERFVTAALLTFASLPYAQASVSTLVRELGIAKGSVYQYFSDKEDCYLTMITIAHERVVHAYRERVTSQYIRETDPFVVIRRYCAQAVQIALDYPAETALLRRAEYEGGVRGERVRVLAAHILRSFVHELLESPAASTRLRHDLDAEAVIFVLQAVLSQVTPYITVSMAARDDADEAAVRAAAQRIVVFFDAILLIIEQGLRPIPGGDHAQSQRA